MEKKLSKKWGVEEEPLLGAVLTNAMLIIEKNQENSILFMMFILFKVIFMNLWICFAKNSC